MNPSFCTHASVTYHTKIDMMMLNGEELHFNLMKHYIKLYYKT